MKESALLALAGLLAGLSGSWALTRYLRSLLHGVATGDTATFVTMPVLLLVIAAGAALVPALRAARIDPVAAFRED
jgi:ABC-type antimicrobial peptide transport system permease subunit